MSNCLPLMSGLNVQALSRTFQSTTTSYKFAFLQALLNGCSQRGFTQFDGRLSLEELAVEMAAFAWYPRTFHKLTFGRQDELGHILDSLAFSTDGKSLTAAAIQRKLRYALVKNYSAIGLGSILRYVPYRLLTPFFEDALRRRPDHQKDQIICRLAEETFLTDAPPLYRFIEKELKVEMHPKWLAYLQESFGVVSGWLAHNWVMFLQNRNPSVPAIPFKIRPPASRASLKTQLKRWSRIIETSEVRCIYSDQILLPNHFAVDHFIPWSFVCHDQPWNLVPVLPAANASKSNYLPSAKYIDRFARAQSLGLKLAKAEFSPLEWGLYAEPFLADLRISEEGLLTPSMLSEALYSNLLPMIALAKQTGFSPDWDYRSNITPTIS